MLEDILGIVRNDKEIKFHVALISYLIKKHYPNQHFVFTEEMMKEVSEKILLRRWKNGQCHFHLVSNEEEEKIINEKYYKNKDKLSDNEEEKLNKLIKILEQLEQIRKDI